MRRGVKHHAVVLLGHLLDLQSEVVDDPLHLRAPHAEICCGGLQGGDACILLVVVVPDSELLQLAADRLELREPDVDGLVLGATVLVEVGEAMLPLSLVVVESAPELELGLLDLI